MPTTSNFGWTTPADTDLVKDGAAAIRTLGNGIDSSLVDLKGGTTGQILSKASNTDLDYTWIANDQGDITEVQGGTGISVASGTGPVPVVTNTVATTFDAKGDLVVGTGADTFAKLTVGTNGYTLVADSSVSPTGLKWAVDPVADVITTAGDLIYGTAADTVARLGIGTAGQVLKVNSGATAPEWGAAGSAAALTKITSGTFSSQASVAVDSVFSSTYRNYMAVIQLLAATGSDDGQLQLRYAGPTTQTTTYYNGGFSYNSSNALTTFGAANASQCTISPTLGTGGGSSVFTVYFSKVGNSVNDNGIFFGSGIGGEGQHICNFSSLQDTQRNYTGFLIKSSSSNITGSYAVYGLEN